MDKEFNDIFAETLGYEGGVDERNPNNVANMGIEQTTLDSWNKRHKLPPEDVKNLSYGKARDIAYQDYYTDPKVDKAFGRKLKGAMFDYEYNSGNRTSVKALQEILGTKADGKIGPKTLKALKASIKANGEEAIVGALIDQREQFMQELMIKNPAKYEENRNGWANRIQKQRALYLQSPNVGGNPQ